jgi:hypothetical protein
VKRALVAALLVTLAAEARAAESRRWGSFEIGAGTYEPDLDAEFGGVESPFQDVFGSGRGWMFRTGAALALFRFAGTVEAGLQSGFLQKTGKAQTLEQTDSGDDTRLRLIPVSLTLTYRFEWLNDRYRIPFAPYGRVGLERFHWWVEDGNGDTSESGATNGWSATAGLALLLDFIDPQIAREFDNDAGVNDTYLFFEVTRRSVHDFGSSSSWNMSDEDFGMNFGLMFVF